MKKYFSMLIFFLVFVFLFIVLRMNQRREEASSLGNFNNLPTNSYLPTAEPVEYKNEEECWPDDGTSWRDIGGCGELRAATIISLAEKEEAKNKINLVQSDETPSYPRKYTSEKYGYSINFPADWSFDTYNYEIFENLSLSGPMVGEEAVQITIGSGQVYSTSGALCANQGCDYEGGTVVFNNGKKATLTKSYLFKSIGGSIIPNDTVVEHYRFSLPLRELIKNFTDEDYIYLTASFPNEEKGNQILNILSTLKAVE